MAGYLKNGDKVEILEQKLVGSMVWGRIATGWISMDYVQLEQSKDETPSQPEPTEPPATEPPATEPPATQPEAPVQQVRTGKVKVSDRLRVRSGPSTATAVVAYLRNGDKVTITETTTSGSMTWGKTDKGWVSMDYIVLDAQQSENNSTQSQSTGTVQVKDFLRIRSGPGTSYAIAGYLSNGAKVTITEQKTVGSMRWGKIDKGWISLDYVTFDGQTQAPQTVTKTVTADCLRVRSGPGTANKIVGYLYEGAKVEILETAQVGNVTWGRTQKGWISLEYVK